MANTKPYQKSAQPKSESNYRGVYDIATELEAYRPSENGKLNPFDVDLEGKGASGPFKGPPENKRLTDNTIEGLQRLYPGLSEAAARKIDQQAKRLAEGFNAEATKTSEHRPPERAPALWAERTTGRKVSPADFICQHYGNRSGDPARWNPEGLTRSAIRQADRELYQALATYVRRVSRDALPRGLREIWPDETPRERLNRELEERGIDNPSDAYKIAGGDRKLADRLYQAALHRRKLGS